LPALLLCLALSSPATAQESPVEPEKQVHWAMAAVFGTGWYRVDENRSSFIFRIPPRQTLRRAGWTESGERQLGLEILYPVTLGLHQLDELPDLIEYDNYSTITFTPGVALTYPVSERWWLRPYLHYGVGYEGTSDEWARVWYGGVKSRFAFREAGRNTWSLLTAVNFAGYKPQYKNRGQYGAVQVGVETRHRLANFRWFGEPTRLDWHLIYDYYFDQLNFHVSVDEVVSIRDSWELGVAIGLVDRPIRIGWFSFQRLGLSYRWSSDGEYDAVTFNLRSHFTR
jgi:hypothetical protein